jgi:hypothetical protein
MKGTFSERPKKVKRVVPTVEEASVDTKKAKRKAAKEQARQLNPGGATPVVQPVAHVGGYGQASPMQQGKFIKCVCMVGYHILVWETQVYFLLWLSQY